MTSFKAPLGKSKQIKTKEVETKSVLKYQSLTLLQSDHMRCNVIKPNRLCCNKKAVARVIDCPPDVFEEVNGNVVCSGHLELIKAAGQKYGFAVKEMQDIEAKQLELKF